MTSTPGSATPAVLSLQGVSKRFGAVQALRDASFECRAGEIHAVVGENGSGKSTLLGIASGVLQPDEGTIEIDGRRLHTGDAVDAIRLGVSTAYQAYSHVLELTVAENLFLATPPSERPSFRIMSSWAGETLRRFGLQVAPGARMRDLNLADRQLLEVVKSLLSSPKVLLLDEPTTALGPGEVDRLHELVIEKSKEGVGVVYVSHRLPEVLGLVDRVTVLRDGQTQGTFEAREMSEDNLVALMIGRPIQLAFPDRNGKGNRDEVMLSVSDLRGRRFGPVDFTLGRGEILGVAGAEGNGQDELLRSLAGIEQATGTVRCNGSTVDLGSPYAGLRAGILFLSGDRVGESLFPVLAIRANSTIQVLRRLSRIGLVRRGKEYDTVSAIVRRLKVRTPSIEQPVRFLSGGNQQKVALARPFLRGDVHVILADEPTQGVDIGARFDIYEALRTKADEGVAMVIKSSDPLELSGLCDRVLVVSRGRIVDEIAAEDLNERRITEAIVGSGRSRVPVPGSTETTS